jgi:hypothetical protein
MHFIISEFTSFLFFENLIYDVISSKDRLSWFFSLCKINFMIDRIYRK